MFDRIFIDMDGVLADLMGHVFIMLKIDEPDVEWPVGEYSIAEALGVDDDDLWEQIGNAGIRFWETLRPYSWKDELLDLARSYLLRPGGELCFVSKPTDRPECLAGKLAWLHKHVPEVAGRQNYMLGEPKWLLAQRGRLLIDDSDHNEQKFRENNGAALLFPQVWNANWQYVGSRMAYVREMFAQESREYLEACGPQA